MTGSMKAIISNSAKLILILCGSGLVFTALGAESYTEGIPVRYEKSAPHTSPCPNALYETISGFKNIKVVGVRGEQTLKLRVPGFTDTVAVKAVIHNQPAPLAVVLLGIGGTTKSDFSKLWPEWFAEAGYNVLYFDSTFLPAMADLINRGPSGNLWSETEAVRDIISAFLRLSETLGKITKIGVVGMSYGGLEALILGQMETEGRLPFQLAGIQVYSPPLDLKKTTAILDRWYDKHRWDYKLAELKREVGDYNFRRDECNNKLSDPMLKAAIAASFHEDLAPVVIREDSHYKLHLLPGGSEFNDEYERENYAGQWGFQDYVYKLALPYWERKLGEGAVDRLIEDTKLRNLLRRQPAATEVIITENDPLDEPEDLADLKNWQPPAGRVTFIPQGGHLGYAGDEWTRDKLLSLFAPAAVWELR